MTAIAARALPARPDAERNLFLGLVAGVWVGVLSGFGTDSYSHILKHGLDYPPIVHLHAVCFVGWLVLFTAQVLLIRGGRADLHRRLGVAMVALLAAMLVIGPATAIVVDARAYVLRGETPEFVAVQFTDIVGLALLAGAGLLLRRDSAAHKRLMIMSLIYISDAGFARWIDAEAAKPLRDGLLSDWVQGYFGSDLLLLALGAGDLILRRRLHPVWFAGAAVFAALHLLAIAGLHSAAWKAISLHLIGH